MSGRWRQTRQAAATTRSDYCQYTLIASTTTSVIWKAAKKDYLLRLYLEIFLGQCEQPHLNPEEAPTNDSRYRPRPAATESGGTTLSSKPLHNSPQNPLDRLSKPFRCPGSATPTRASDKPARKRRKVNYAGADGNADEGEKPYTNEERLALATRDVNRFPVFKPKDKDTTFKQRFKVPLVNKTSDAYDASRPAPTLGMRRGATFVVKPLHDPSGEFAIVLYDPTVDDVEKESESKLEDQTEQPKLDEPIMHKSLADILGLKKEVDTRPKVPVVIDPKLAKILRPHQVEGVKVRSSVHYATANGLIDHQ